MEEIELSRTSSPQGDSEKRNAERKRAPAVIVFTSTRALWATFALIYGVSFLLCLVGAVVLSMDSYVMSHFSGHNILTVLTMVVLIVSGILRLPMAKFIDEFGRAHGFLMAAGLSIMGLIIQAAAQSLVTTIVAQVLFGIGWNCLDYVLSIVLADMTSLKNRALIYGIYVTPIVITSFAAPAIAEQIYSRFGWRMAFSGFLLVFHGPEAPAPALVIFQMFIGYSLRFFIACSQMAVMANIDHKDVALSVGIWGTFVSIAAAVGSGISGSIWARAVPPVLLDSLPADSRNFTEAITGSSENEKTYPIGSPIRDSVVTAIWAAQEEMVIMGLCFVPVAFACIFMWRNINVRKIDNGEKVAARAVIW
ncbi:hypothetical protein INS49_004409 [Diaporthe citri]|uniref:uncharacterized protein n=1 Tax=Diaporthe citri TaxID=83186 RepID=UPI001C7E24BE|nr:uncharacterized protein INS49_004409 [Diaporthe citri]KAG6354392.1 hypothetical protein INS49_004409 [Diaporthe citri]